MEKVINLEPIHFVYLVLGFGFTVIVIWAVFWLAVARTSTKPLSIINSNKFLQVVTVGLTLSAVAILSLARVLSGEIAGIIISGVVGYVLGNATAGLPKSPVLRTDGNKIDELEQ